MNTSRKGLDRHFGGSTVRLALLVGIGVASAPALAEPVMIPLDYHYVKVDGKDVLSRITTWMSINEGAPQRVLFDTGSTSANLQIGSDVSGTTPTPGTDPRGSFYGDGTYGYLLHQVDVKDIGYHAADGKGGQTLPITGQSTYQVAKIVDVIYTKDYKGPIKVDLSHEPVYRQRNDDGSETLYYADLNARKLIKNDEAVDEGALWGTLGAGDFISKDAVGSEHTSGLFGRATDTGYLISANGSSEAGKQDLTPGCSPCLVVGLDSAVRAQFTSAMPWGDKAAEDIQGTVETFPSSGANASAEFEGTYTLSFGDDEGAPAIKKVATLLDTGTPGGGQLTISTERLNAIVAAGVEVKVDKDGSKTVEAITLAAPDGQPVALTNVEINEIPGGVDVPVQFVAGMDFFMSQTVMYDLENSTTAYTPYFVSATSFTTDAGNAGVERLSRITPEMGSAMVVTDEQGTETNVGFFGVAGVISGASDLTISERALLRLSNINSYSGQTLIEAGGTLELAGIGSIEKSSRVVADGILDIRNKGNRLSFWGISDAYNDTRIRSLAGTGSVFLGDRDLMLTAAHDTFSGIISDLDESGAHRGGGLTIQGGVQVLSGESIYTGTTTINSGAGLILASAGSLESDVQVSGEFANHGHVKASTSVQDGGITGGTGTFDNLTIGNGGTVVTGGVTSLKVAEDFVQEAGSTLVFGRVSGEALAGIAISGRAVIEDGAGVALNREAVDRLSLGQDYILLTAVDGASGGYTLKGDYVTDAPFLSFQLNNAPASITLSVGRSDHAFADMAGTANQVSVANGLEALDNGNLLYDQVLHMTAAQAAALAPDLDTLSGEIQASMQSALIEESHFLRDAVNGRLRAASGTVGVPVGRVQALTADGLVDTAATEDGPVVWGHAFGAWGKTDGDGNAARLDRQTNGLIVGYDTTVDDWRLGGVLAMSDSSYDAEDRASSGSNRGIHLGGYAGTHWGSVGFRGGVIYSDHSLKANRAATIGGVHENLSSKYGGHTWQAFGELGRQLVWGNRILETYAGLAHVRLYTDSFVEGGGETALRAGNGKMNTTFTTIGLRGASTIHTSGQEIEVSGGIGWRHAFGDVRPELTRTFGDGGDFGVTGVAIARNAAVLDIGADIALGESSSMRLDYQGQLASDAREHRMNASFRMRF